MDTVFITITNPFQQVDTVMSSPNFWLCLSSLCCSSIDSLLFLKILCAKTCNTVRQTLQIPTSIMAAKARHEAKTYPKTEKFTSQ